MGPWSMAMVEDVQGHMDKNMVFPAIFLLLVLPVGSTIPTRTILLLGPNNNVQAHKPTSPHFSVRHPSHQASADARRRR